jgi:hypothetical protein|tara:strand:- start:411 stop:737 length:327 start_codon:yes stop_codon:yes gene_type:complete
MIAPRIAPYRASSVRVHLCPTLPDQLEEVELEEHCEWGLVKCAGTSQILRLPQGAAVVLEMDGEVHTLQWMGMYLLAMALLLWLYLLTTALLARCTRCSGWGCAPTWP